MFNLYRKRVKFWKHGNEYILGVNPLRTKTTLHVYLFLTGNKSLLYHQIGNRNVSIFITIQWNLMFCVDKLQYEHLAILSNLKSCQFAPRIVIFNLCVCCQFENSQIILPKIIPMSHRNIELWQMRANFLQYIFLFLLVHNSEFLENFNQELLYQTTFWSGLVLNGLMHWCSHSKQERKKIFVLHQNSVFLPTKICR